MTRKQKLTDNDRDLIVIKNNRNELTFDIAQSIGISQSTVNTVLYSYGIAKHRNVDELIELLKRNRSLDEIRWACKCHGYEVPDEVIEFYNNKNPKTATKESNDTAVIKNRDDTNAIIATELHSIRQILEEILYILK